MAELHIQALSHGFPTRSGWTDVLHNINLRIADGEFVCLVGPSGCGKSTLLNAIGGFIMPTKGVVELDREPVRGPSGDRVVVFQDVHNSLFPWMTVRENVEFGLKMRNVGRKERRIKVDALLQLVRLKEHDDKFPDELSGGMKQRVQIARALAVEPQVLLMDEPFAALDAQTRRAMQSELLRIWQQTKTSIFFITHDIIEAVTLADRIAIMSRGPAATLTQIITPDLERPRSFRNERFAALIARIEATMGLEQTNA